MHGFTATVENKTVLIVELYHNYTNTFPISYYKTHIQEPF